MKKRTKIILVVILLLIGSISSFFYFKEDNFLIEEDNTEEIKSHYSEYVVTNSSAKIYDIDENEVGTLNGVELTLNEIDITSNTKYFEFNMNDITYKISYEDVSKIDALSIVDDRYKNYIVFNESVSTDKLNLYSEDKLVMSIDGDITLPIIIKDDDLYYVEFDGKLYSVKRSEVDVIVSDNTDVKGASDIPSTLYHFMYKEEEKKDCTEVICHSETQVRSHFDYLVENNYFTMNTKEMEYWIDGKINVPENSILITIDDAAWHQNWNWIVSEYEINVTYFVVTEWIDLENITTPYIELAAHTHAQHYTGVCPGGQGSAMKCLDKDVLLEDLALNRGLLNNTDSFAYPFFEYNDYAIEVLKEAGFKTAYRGGMTNVTRGVDKFKIPRITMFSYTSMNEFINYVS